MTNQEVIEIQHINPNCLGAKYCAPHGETGQVTYTEKGMKLYAIEILKGLLMKEDTSRSTDSMDYEYKNGYNQAVSEQNAKIQAVINKLEREVDG